jgi:hypothetical protein
MRIAQVLFRAWQISGSEFRRAFSGGKELKSVEPVRALPAARNYTVWASISKIEIEPVGASGNLQLKKIRQAIIDRLPFSLQRWLSRLVTRPVRWLRL